MLTEIEKKELVELTNLLEQRNKFYSIRTVKLQPHQQLLEDAITAKVEYIRNREKLYKPKYRKILFQGGNGSGKTFIGLEITVRLALGDLCSQYELKYIGSRKDIWIVTKSGANVNSTIEPYLLGDYSKTRIPPDAIEKITKDNGTLKSILLKNGTKISIRTYDQGYERLQGGNPDYILVDEEPTDKKVWEEILARGRSLQCQIVITMTPLNGLTPVYEYFYEQKNEEVKESSKVILVSSLDNKFADHSGLLGLSEQDKKMRIYGMFIPPSGLVYSNFNRYEHVVQHFKPELLGEDIRYYGAIDFGNTHPTAFLAIAVDIDNNIYIFDMFYKKGLLVREMAENIKEIKNKYGIEFEYIVADAASKQQREDLKDFGIKTIPSDKWSRGENNESNRKAGILKVNGLLSDRKLFISDKCTDLITEFEQHHYKESARDGEVEKTQDDALDALRYFIFGYKPRKVEEFIRKDFKKETGINLNKYNNYTINYNNPY